MKQLHDHLISIHLLKPNSFISQGPSFYPLSHPPLPTEEILEYPSLCKIVLDLAAVLDCRALFAEPGEGDIHGAT